MASDEPANIYQLRRIREQSRERTDAAPPILKAGDGDGTSGGMESRVARLEEQMAGVRDDLRDIKDSLRVLPTLPTRRDLVSYFVGAASLALAVVATIVGGLSWLETRAARITPQPGPNLPVQPIVIQLAPPAQAAAKRP